MAGLGQMVSFRLSPENVGRGHGKVCKIGFDPAKDCRQFHGRAKNGKMVFRKKLVRHKVLDILALRPSRPAAMKACASAGW